MKLSEKQIEKLDKACLKKFGINFDSMYKMVEVNEELKKKAEFEIKEAKRLQKLQKQLEKENKKQKKV